MRKIIFLPIICLVTVLIVMAKTTSVIPPINKLRMAEQAITMLYVDSVDENLLVENAIRGMLEKLDPHSEYSTPEETRELNEPLQGSFSGIGITFNLNNDTVYVIQTISGGPSEKVGILAGDRIIAVNDSSIAGMKMKRNDIMKRLRGPKGSKVNLKILRKSSPGAETIDFRLTRDQIPIKSIDAAYMVNDSTAYIRVNKFAADTGNEFNNALRQLKNQGMHNLILDLTDNGGGYLNSSVEILGELLEPGSLAVYTEGNSSSRYNHTAMPSDFYKPLFGDGRLVIMVNQYSASASEITSGALQDWDRGVVVGRRTFGKGLVQRPIPFPDGSMMRLTTAHYYTPSGRDIQKPYEKGRQEDYQRDMLDRLNHGELMHADSIHYNDSLKVKTLRTQREVYGGGGITPDRFVPLDTTEYTKYYRQLVAKGLINKVAIDYVDKNRKELKKKYRNDDAFVHDFSIDPSMLDELRRLADEEKIEFNEEQFNRSHNLILLILKALIGRDVFDDQTYFKVYNSHDPIYSEALRIITNPEEYSNLLKP